MVDLSDWLKEKEEAVVGRWLVAVQDKAIPHYEGLTVDRLREELTPLYHCLVSTTTLSGLDITTDTTAALSDWMLDQRAAQPLLQPVRATGDNLSTPVNHRPGLGGIW
jgi:hypothetical protein